MGAKEVHMILNYFRGIYKQVEEDWEKIARKYDLTAPQLHILWVLSFENGLNLSEISERSLLHISTVSDLIKRMERKGLLERKEGLDRRKVRVFITEKGQKLKENSQRECRDAFKIMSFLENLSPSSKNFFMDSIAKLTGELRNDDFVDWVVWSGSMIEK